jgi:hypothetical protein
MGKSERYPSYATCVAHALSTSAQPLSIDALLSTIGRQRPLGKGARHAIYRAVRQLYQAVPVAPSRIGWLSHLMQESTFRHPLTAEEVRRGYLLLDELEHAVFFPQFFQHHRTDVRHINVELMGGPVLRAEAAVERKMWSLRLGVAFAEWIDEQGGQSRDDILITVINAVEGRYMVRLHPRESRDEEAIQEQNIRLAMAAEELVATSRRAQKAIPAWELAALLIGRDVYRGPIPPDDLHMVLHKYSVLHLAEDGAGYTLNRRISVEAGDAPPAQRADKQRRRPLNSIDDEPEGSDLDAFLAPQEFSFEESAVWLDNESNFPDMPGGEDSCLDYESYLEAHLVSGDPDAPLSHSDYHLLEAELETLLGLEQEFGYLLPEQSKRVDALAERLFIDPESLTFDDDDSGFSDDNFDSDSPFWKN